MAEAPYLLTWGSWPGFCSVVTEMINTKVAPYLFTLDGFKSFIAFNSSKVSNIPLMYTIQNFAGQNIIVFRADTVFKTQCEHGATIILISSVLL